MPTWDNPLITILPDKCRMCYACVRECPAKAIQVVDGQARVMQPRCIACGNCLRVCSQNAKQVRDDTERTFSLLESDARVAALVAPSFPAEFVDIPQSTLVAMIRALGFDSVHEIALGADLVADAYRRLQEDHPDGRYITTPCPAVVSYVRKYHSRLMPNLAPLVSPMVAMARVLRDDLGENLQVVFIGPCVAKKRASVDITHHEFEAVLTFAELRDMFAKRGIRPEYFADSNDEFDPPYGGVGMVFPISGGLLQTANMKEDLLSGEVIVAEGRDEFVDTISQFEEGDDGARLLDVLACQGCYAGAGMTSDISMLQRRSLISEYARNRLKDFTTEELDEIQSAKEKYRHIDLSREHLADEQTLGDSATAEELEDILHRMGKYRTEDLLNCGACGYDGCLDHARAVYAGLADSEMCLPHAIEQLREAYGELEESHRSLEEAKEALERSGKLASMGQLAAGIAHEVNNPLGTLLLHANLALEECEDEQMKSDLETILDQGNRCKRIISGLLNFARQSRVLRQPTNVLELVEKTIRTAPAVNNISVKVDNRLTDPVADIDGDQMVQVFTNLYTNAQHAMPDGGDLTIELSDDADSVTIKVSDTGVGISAENMGKLFSPFFTTKQVGMGTGLGLAVSHGIVKMHKGQITAESNADPSAGPTGTTFTVTFPRHE